jgi:hypothetical protein
MFTEGVYLWTYLDCPHFFGRVHRMEEHPVTADHRWHGAHGVGLGELRGRGNGLFWLFIAVSRCICRKKYFYLEQKTWWHGQAEVLLT